MDIDSDFIANKPINKPFIQNVLQHNEMELVEEEVIPPPPDPEKCILGYHHLYICKYVFVSLNK